jgi:hypothetical protein
MNIGINKLYVIYMDYLLYILFITIIFIVWVEYSIGGILLRPDSSGYVSFNFSSLLNFMINPLYNNFLWNIKILDSNYVFIIIISSLFHWFILY